MIERKECCEFKGDEITKIKEKRKCQEKIEEKIP